MAIITDVQLCTDESCAASTSAKPLPPSASFTLISCDSGSTPPCTAVKSKPSKQQESASAQRRRKRNEQAQSVLVGRSGSSRISPAAGAAGPSTNHADAPVYNSLSLLQRAGNAASSQGGKWYYGKARVMGFMSHGGNTGSLLANLKNNGGGGLKSGDFGLIQPLLQAEMRLMLQGLIPNISDELCCSMGDGTPVIMQMDQVRKDGHKPPSIDSICRYKCRGVDENGEAIEAVYLGVSNAFEEQDPVDIPRAELLPEVKESGPPAAPIARRHTSSRGLKWKAVKIADRVEDLRLPV